MSETAPQKLPELKAEDLGLIDDSLEDEGKDDATLWADIEEAEADAKANGAADDESGAASAEAAAAAASKEAGDEAGKTGDEGTSLDDESGDKTPDTPAADQDDPFADATPEQRAAHDAAQAQIKKLEQSERSTRGRLGSMQRRINELSAQPVPATPPAADKAAGDDKDAGGDGKDYLASDGFKEFEKEFPEVAGPMKELVSGMQAEVSQLRRGQDAISQDRHQDQVSEQQGILEEEHEDWEEVMAANELLPWLDKQPRHIQEAAVRNAEEIVDAAEAADVVSRFKAFRSAQSDAGDDTPDADDTETPPAGDEGKGDGTTPLTGKRQRQLDAASSTRTGGPSAAHGIPEDGDPEEIWKAFDKKEQREAQRA